jgi:hypothetical protein
MRLAYHMVALNDMSCATSCIASKDRWQRQPSIFIFIDAMTLGKVKYGGSRRSKVAAMGYNERTHRRVDFKVRETIDIMMFLLTQFI